MAQTKRCRKGYRKCVSGRCSRKNPSFVKTGKCRNGMRRCAVGKCYYKDKSLRRKKGVRRTYRLRNRLVPAVEAV